TLFYKRVHYMKKLSTLIFVTVASGLLMSDTLMNVPVQASKEENQTDISDEDDIDSWMPDKNLQTELSYQLGKMGEPLTKDNLKQLSGSPILGYSGLRDSG